MRCKDTPKENCQRRELTRETNEAAKKARHPALPLRGYFYQGGGWISCLQMTNWNVKKGINQILPGDLEQFLILIIRAKKDKIKSLRKTYESKQKT